MHLLYALRLSKEFLGCRYNYNHVGLRVGMMILVGYVVHILGCGKGGS